MAERYAELFLYFGLCPQDGSLEGRFDPEATDPWSKRWYNQSLEQVKRYLSPDSRWGLHYGWSRHSLVDDEDEAKILIDFAEANIPNTEGQLVLVDAMHGRVRFWRKIRFANVSESQRDEIIQLLTGSGYQPKDEERERRISFMKKHPEIWSDEVIEQKMNEEGFDKDRKWRAALVFY